MSGRSLVLAAALVALAGCADGEGELASTLPLTAAPGGFSGIELSDDGSEVVLLSDRAALVFGRLERSGGKLTGFAEDSQLEIGAGENGEPLREWQRDSEGLAKGPDGALYISFEGIHRVARLEEGALVFLPDPPPLPRRMANESYEALAIDEAGTLYTLPERVGDGTADWTLLKLEGDAWQPAFTVPRRGAFVPVGADFGPDGAFYLLERDFTGFAFRSRVRRFAVDGSGETTLLQTGSGTHGNLEGIAVWRGPDGDIRLTMVSDNNQSALLRSEIVEYRLPD
ncbi:esterase-like activity of phytase family protein [Pseudoroseicyclus sp. H15]